MNKRSIGYKRLLTGFIFLLSPDISIFDLLPDFIGYIFIVSGLSRLADIDERARDARALSVRLTVISIIKFILSMYVGSLHKTNLLLVAFSLAVLDLILVLPFIKDFFNSIDYTATRQGIMISSKKTSELKILMLFFFVIKDTLSVLPSVVSLFDPAETGNYNSDLWHVDFSALFNVLTVLSFLIMFVLFLFMTVKNCIYFISLNRNTELVEGLYSNFEKTVLQVPSRIAVKNIKAVSAVLMPSFLFFADFYIDFVDILPTVIGFGLIFVYSLLVRSRMNLPTLALSIFSAVGTAVSAVLFGYRVFWERKLGEGIEYSFSAQNFTAVLGVAGLVATVCVLFLTWKSLEKIEEKYLDTKSTSRTVMLTLITIVLAVLSVILYVYPEKNVIFVFPNALFSIFFVWFVADRIKSVTSQILVKYKKWDFE